MSRFRIVIVAAAIVIGSGITAVVVHMTESHAVVQELRHEDQERKAGEAEAEGWMKATSPPCKSKNELGVCNAQ